MSGQKLGQILEKPCVRFRGHSHGMKLGQNVCLDDIPHEFEYGTCKVKNEVTRSNVRETLCTL